MDDDAHQSLISRRRGSEGAQMANIHHDPSALSQDGSVRLTALTGKTSGASLGHPDMDVELEDWYSDDEVDDEEETGLTHTERQSRRGRKRIHTQLDQRVANGMPSHDKSLHDARFLGGGSVRYLLINGLLIGLWYSFSIAISVYNKWMFSAENLDFQFPLFTTSAHMLMQFLLATLTIYLFPRFRPSRGILDSAAQYSALRNDGEEPHQSSDAADVTPSQPTKAPSMTRWFYLTRVGPCGTATALDIGLGNFSLRYISLTFYTMCKSSTLAFVLLFAFLFRLEKPTWKLCAVITVMISGVLMMVAGETSFNIAGFLLIMGACLCSGFRWSVTQILLLRNPATNNPFSSLFFLTPVMFFALLILAIPIEGVSALVEGYRNLSATHGPVFGAIIMLFPGILAFLMVSAEFALIQRTSVVTLSVCGIFKEVLTVTAASLTFGDDLSPINVSGLIVTIVAIAGYNWLKFHKMKSEVTSAMATDPRADENDVRYSSTIELNGKLGSPLGSPGLEEEVENSRITRDSLVLSPREIDHLDFGEEHAARGYGHMNGSIKSRQNIE